MSQLLREMVEKGDIFTTPVGLSSLPPDLDHDETEEEFFSRMTLQSNMECLVDDDYEGGTPFDRIALKMTDVTADGKLKKRILKEGDGIKPLSGDFVSIDYNGYVEFEPEPFDSTYARKHSHKFEVDHGMVIPGLDCAVRSMRVQEKSQFLIHPDYAYCNLILGRIPPNATVLFEVVLNDVFDKSGIRDYETLPDDDERKHDFDYIHKYCCTLCEQAKRAVKDHNVSIAIKDYNKAHGILAEMLVIEPKNIKSYRELKYRIHSNLAVCYLKNDKPRKTLREVEDIYKLTENGELMNIGAKIYYHHAKSLRILGEYDKAQKVLKKAMIKCRKSKEITDEYLLLVNETKEYKTKQEKLAKAMVAPLIK